MFIFLYGKDTYRSRQKLKEIIEHYKKVHKKGLDLKYFNSERLNFQDFKDEIRTSSMFGQKKLVILVDVFTNSRFKEEFLKEKEIFKKTENIILFYENSSPRKGDPLFKFLKKYGKTQEFVILKGKKLGDWVKKEFEKYKTQIDIQTQRMLIDFIGSDLYRFSNEIKKLVAFKRNKKINLNDVGLLIKPKIETDIFKTIDALASGNRKQALLLFHKHLQNGDSPFYLFTMIAFQFRNLLIVKDLIEKGYDFNSVLEKSKLHPYVARKTYWYAKNFEIKELKRIYQRLFEIDLKIKKGQIPPKVALDLLVFEI